MVAIAQDDLDMGKAMNTNKDNRFVHNVDSKVTRKLRAQQHPGRSVWMGLGTMGIVGWSVAVPTLLCLFLGVWLDKHHPANFSWTLNLLIIGLVLGCLSAWHWVSKEVRAIHKDATEDMSADSISTVSEQVGQTVDQKVGHQAEDKKND